MMTRPDDKQQDDMDWNNLSDPVPMNLLDADFDPAVSDAPSRGQDAPTATPPVSGATSQDASISPPMGMPSDRTAPATGSSVTPRLPEIPGSVPADPGSPNRGVADSASFPTAKIPTHGLSGSEDGRPLPNPVEWPVNAEGVTLPGSRSEALLRETIESMTAPTATRPTPGRDEDQIPDGSMLKEAEEEYARLRAKVEAEAQAEDEAKRKTEQEEAAQQERLAQWMANARARLQQADAGPVPPGTKFRAKREASPTMIRMAEMQRTIFDATAPESPNGVPAGASPISAGAAARAQDAADDAALMPGQSQDPMATIMVPRDQFVEGPATPTRKLKTLEKKVAQIRLAESGAETLIMAAPKPETGRNNVRLAFWVLGGLIPIVFGLGLFALMQTGYLDGLEELIPAFGGPKASAASTGSTGPAAKSGSTASTPVKSAASSPDAAPASAPGAATGSAISPSPSGQPASIESPKPAAAPAPTQLPVSSGPKVTPTLPQKATAPAPVKPIVMAGGRPMPTQSSAPVKAKPEKRPTPVPRAPVAREPVAPVSAKVAKAVKPGKAPSKPAPPAATDELPDQPSATTTVANALANAKNRADASMAGIEIAKLTPSAKAAGADAPANGDAELKASVAAAQSADADNMQAIYDRFATSFPNLSGNVVIGLTVAPNGQIQEGRISTTSTGLADFDQEILHKVLDWKLSAFPDTQPKYVAVAFHFAPKSP